MTLTAASATTPIAVVQGEFHISDDPAALMSTVLGSCVAVCLHDPVCNIGGMNHFLLPFGKEEGTNRPVRYGLFAMEMLINALLKAGAKKSRLQAKLFGGAKISVELRDIGQTNAIFAREYLATEGIQCLAESLGGQNARRLMFRPATGQARMLIVPLTNITATELRTPVPRSASRSAEIELF